MSLQKIIDIPEQNTIRFIDEDAPYPEMQTIRAVDWFARQLRFWDQKTQYFQPYTCDDWVVIQIFVGGAYATNMQNHRIFIHDHEDTVIGSFFPQFIDSIPGNAWDVGGLAYPLYTLTFAFSFSQFNIFSKFLTLRLALFYLEGETPLYDYHRSEPINVEREHPRTIAIGSTCFVNKNNMDFKGGTIAFSLRVQGRVNWSGLTNEAVGFEDQQLNVRQENSVTGKDLTIYFGQKGGLPMWMLSKVNEAFSNDYVVVERERVVKPIKNQLDIQYNDNGYKKYKASLMVKPYDKNELNVVTKKSALVLLDIPDSGVFLAYIIRLKNSVSNQVVDVFTGYAIRTPQQLVDFISTLNSAYVPAKNLNGHFSTQHDNFVYINGENENFDTSTSIFLTSYITLHHERSSLYATPHINMNFTATGKLWAVEPQHNYEVYCYGSETTLVTQSHTYNYLNNGNPSVADTVIWHDSHITEMYITNAFSLKVIFDFIWPVDLVKLVIDQTSMSIFGFAAINNTLQYFQITNSLLTDLLSFDVKNWAALTHIILNNNKFTTAVVDRLFNDHQASTPVVPSALFFGLYAFIINNQNPAATATGVSAASRGVLTGKKWQVLF